MNAYITSYNSDAGTLIYVHLVPYPVTLLGEYFGDYCGSHSDGREPSQLESKARALELQLTLTVGESARATRRIFKSPDTRS